MNQSSTYQTFGPHLAIEGPANNKWKDGCSSTAAGKWSAWWGLLLPELVYVTNIELYYRGGSKCNYFTEQNRFANFHCLTVSPFKQEKNPNLAYPN